MIIAATSYNFIKLIKNKVMTQLDCIKKAKELGFDAIEFSGIIPHDNSSDKEYAKKLREESLRLELPIVCYSFNADFISGSERNTEIAKVKNNIDIGEILGVNIIRHDVAFNSGKYRTFESALPLLAEACREVTIYAHEKGIKTTVENHGLFCQDSERLEKLITAVEHENFGILADMGNFLCADENPATAFGKLSGCVFYVHAKDFYVRAASHKNPGEGFFRSRGGNFLRGAILGHGDVPVGECLAALKQAGYSNGFTIEFEGMEDIFTGMKIGLANLRNYINQID